ncbi:protein of unknown function (plasmid) [Cupriavidus taiwanensis]|uniref:Uncharacterized protein n=1 Tax=Cupriavidus taiwanensis TaxID=164546 RepID=A0A375IIX0_9BURK|nr:hypothetical protein CBM2588_B150002 [Cupriavidus taiwanensis]SOY64900.1 hypothetical protein CBM2592_B120002 [Cupriavidus taiwanensis]SOY94075.1 hypothetical protein CBM2591_B110001 [Cupriavidus taiwanensis]SOZ27241.1 hypothetical protein CBM2608_B110001 [Cupriavidus taiwanensis]SOZ69227.1 hypothetical protein CBM2617_B150002 [Cupriavidus taiwanensis]
MQQSPVQRAPCGAPRMLVSHGSQELDQKSFPCLSPNTHNVSRRATCPYANCPHLVSQS